MASASVDAFESWWRHVAQNASALRSGACPLDLTARDLSALCTARRQHSKEYPRGLRLALDVVACAPAVLIRGGDDGRVPLHVDLSPFTSAVAVTLVGLTVRGVHSAASVASIELIDCGVRIAPGTARPLRAVRRLAFSGIPMDAALIAMCGATLRRVEATRQHSAPPAGLWRHRHCHSEHSSSAAEHRDNKDVNNSDNNNSNSSNNSTSNNNNNSNKDSDGNSDADAKGDSVSDGIDGGAQAGAFAALTHVWVHAADVALTAPLDATWLRLRSLVSIAMRGVLLDSCAALDALRHMPELRQLDLCGNLLDNVAAIPNIAPRLLSLNVACNRLVTLRGLDELSLVHELDARDNSLSDWGDVCRFAQSAPHALKVLSLRCNPLCATDDIAARLARAFRHHRHLRIDVVSSAAWRMRYCGSESDELEDAETENGSSSAASSSNTRKAKRCAPREVQVNPKSNKGLSLSTGGSTASKTGLVSSKTGPLLSSKAGPSLLSNAGPSLLSNTGPSLLSNAGPSLLSNAGPSLLSNAGPSLLSNAGPSLLSNTRPRPLSCNAGAASPNAGAASSNAGPLACNRVSTSSHTNLSLLDPHQSQLNQEPPSPLHTFRSSFNGMSTSSLSLSMYPALSTSDAPVPTPLLRAFLDELLRHAWGDTVTLRVAPVSSGLWGDAAPHPTALEAHLLARGTAGRCLVRVSQQPCGGARAVRVDVADLSAAPVAFAVPQPPVLCARLQCASSAVGCVSGRVAALMSDCDVYGAAKASLLLGVVVAASHVAAVLRLLRRRVALCQSALAARGEVRLWPLALEAARGAVGINAKAPDADVLAALPRLASVFAAARANLSFRGDFGEAREVAVVVAACADGLVVARDPPQRHLLSAATNTNTNTTTSTSTSTSSSSSSKSHKDSIAPVVVATVPVAALDRVALACAGQTLIAGGLVLHFRDAGQGAARSIAAGLSRAAAPARLPVDVVATAYDDDSTAASFAAGVFLRLASLLAAPERLKAAAAAKRHRTCGGPGGLSAAHPLREMPLEAMAAVTLVVAARHVALFVEDTPIDAAALSAPGGDGGGGGGGGGRVLPAPNVQRVALGDVADVRGVRVAGPRAHALLFAITWANGCQWVFAAQHISVIIAVIAELQQRREEGVSVAETDTFD